MKFIHFEIISIATIWLEFVKAFDIWFKSTHSIQSYTHLNCCCCEVNVLVIFLGTYLLSAYSKSQLFENSLLG